MDFCCVRHGRTAWNAQRRFQGSIDIPLDDVGRAQARALGVHLRLDTFDAAFSSDLSRAKATAEAILENRAVPLVLDPDLREMAFGTWEGLTWPEIVAKHPELDVSNETKPRVYTPDGGESFDQLCDRVSRAMNRIRERLRPEASVLIATHAGVIHALLKVFGETEGQALGVRLVPASITRFSDGPDGPRLVSLNEVAAGYSDISA